MKNILSFLIIFLVGNYSKNVFAQEIKTFDLEIKVYMHEPYGVYSTFINNTSLQKNNEPQKNDTPVEKLNITKEQEQNFKKLLKKLPLKKKIQNHENKKIIDGASISFDIKIDGKKYKINYTNYPLHKEFRDLVNFVNEIAPNDKIPYSK